jgi:hypothetical protein
LSKKLYCFTNTSRRLGDSGRLSIAPKELPGVKTLLAPAAALLVVATAAVAQPEGSSPGTENQTSTKVDQKNERLVCRWVQDSDVGSLIRGRTRRCLTAEQWQALRGR